MKRTAAQKLARVELNGMLLGVFIVLGMAAAPCFGADHPAVVKIKGGCTAVCVSASGLIMTARHCGQEQTVTVSVGSKEVSAKLVHVGQGAGDGPMVYDLDGDGYRFVGVGSGVPAVGDAVYCVGYPGGDDENKVVMKGKVTGGKTCSHGAQGNVVDFQTMPGMSGCPLFNAQDKVIGLLHGGEQGGSLFLGCAATRAAYDAVAPKGGQAMPLVKPVLYVFMRPAGQCPACDEFKTDVRGGHFNEYEIRYVTWDGDRWDDQGIAAVVRAMTKKTALLATPTFWPQGSTEIREGYERKERKNLLGWIDGVFKEILDIPAAIVGEASDEQPPSPPMPISPSPAGTPELGESTPIPTGEIDWTGIVLGVAASEATPRIFRLGKGPAKRAVEEMSGRKASLVVAGEITTPARYKAVVDASGATPNPLFLFALVPRQNLGLKGIIAKKIEQKAEGILASHEKVPIEVVFERTHSDLYAALVTAFQIPEKTAFERSEDSREPGVGKSAVEKIATGVLQKTGLSAKLDGKLAKLEAKIAGKADDEKTKVPWFWGLLAGLAGAARRRFLETG